MCRWRATCASARPPPWPTLARTWWLRFSKQVDAKRWTSTAPGSRISRSSRPSRTREAFSPRGFQEATARINRAAALPTVKVLVDRDPMILLLTEKEDFARRLGEALSRKFGLAMLDHIKGPVKAQIKGIDAGDEGWGRARLVVVHNQLRLASPLELCRQLMDQEAAQCP